jgi:hypothetical protein
VCARGLSHRCPPRQIQRRIEAERLGAMRQNAKVSGAQPAEVEGDAAPERFPAETSEADGVSLQEGSSQP